VKNPQARDCEGGLEFLENIDFINTVNAFWFDPDWGRVNSVPSSSGLISRTSTVRGFSRAVILWLISQKPMSGYKIVKEMKRLTGQKFNPGIIYPLLYKL